MGEVDRLMTELRKLPVDGRGSVMAKLMELAGDGDSRTGVLFGWLRLCTKGVLKGEDFEPHLPTLLSFWRDVYGQARPMQRSASELDWMIDEEYFGIRNRAGLLLDLMGYLPVRQVEDCLREGLSLADPRLKLFAALSLLRHSQYVDPAGLEMIAASHEVRIVLWEELRRLKMEPLMPQRWSAPEELAASDLSRWVSHEMELGVPPEEIELMGRFPVSVEGYTADAYLFRFREYPKPWEPGEGWMAGTAGPFRDGEAIGSCWSAFEQWDSLSPKEHFIKLHGTVGGGG